MNGRDGRRTTAVPGRRPRALSALMVAAALAAGAALSGCDGEPRPEQVEEAPVEEAPVEEAPAEPADVEEAPADVEEPPPVPGDVVPEEEVPSPTDDAVEDEPPKEERVRPDDRLVGCWGLEVGDWTTAAGEAVAAQRAPRVPEMVRLHRDELEGWPSLHRRYGEVYGASTWVDGAFRSAPFAYWRPVDGDSIFVGHPGAMAGMEIRAAVPKAEKEERPELEGCIVAFGDAIAPDRDPEELRLEAPLRLRPVDCP